jgi:hypothetical protein
MSVPTYAIFAGQIYYPAGGGYDLYGFAETFHDALIIYEEAISIGSKPMKYWSGIIQCSNHNTPRDWAHIVNLKTNKIVVENHVNSRRTD